MRLRQIALAARDLDAVVADVEAALGIEVAYNDPGVAVFGLRNAVLPIGDTFLEIVSPVSEDAAADRYMARRGGDCGYMVMVQAPDTDAARRRAAELGVRVAWSIDLDDIRGTHFHPRDLGGPLLSVDTATPPGAWRWAGPTWPEHVRTGVVREIAGVDMACAEPKQVARRWGALLGREPVPGPGGAWMLALERGTLRFVAGGQGGDGVVGLTIAAVDPAAVLARARARGLPVGADAVTLCGTQFRVV